MIGVYAVTIICKSCCCLRMLCLSAVRFELYAITFFSNNNPDHCEFFHDNVCHVIVSIGAFIIFKLIKYQMRAYYIVLTALLLYDLANLFR